MYNNFLEQTILTGKINDIFLQDFPNSLLIQQSTDYRLSIENEWFICKMQVFLVNGVTHTVYLPINTSSKNYIVDWGDQSSSQLFEIVCKDIYNPKNNNAVDKNNLFTGAAYYQLSENDDEGILSSINVYIDNRFYNFDNCNIECDNITNYAIRINKSKNKADEYFLYNYNSKMDHKYDNIQKYYFIKIKGGFTGFNNLANNQFYKISDNATNNYNIIKIPNVNQISGTFNVSDISGICGSYKLKNENSVKTDIIYEYEDSKGNIISGYIYKKVYSYLTSNINVNVNKKIIANNTKIEIYDDNPALNEKDYENQILFWYDSKNDKTLTSYVSGNFRKDKSVIKITVNNEEISWTNELETYNKQLYSLTEILSWGTNTNWQDMNYAFYNAKKLKKIPNTPLPNVNQFKSCFEKCEKLQIDNLNNLMPYAAIDTTKMFYDSSIREEKISTFVMSPNNSIITNMFNPVSDNSYLPYNYKNFNYISGQISVLNINIEKSAIYNESNILIGESVSAYYSDDCKSKKYRIQYTDAIQLDQITWNTYEAPITVNNSCIIYFKGIDAFENDSNIKSININIDLN